jgi:hypothetical protein
MCKSLSFFSIFKTRFIVNEIAKIVSHPVRVEIFTGAKTYKNPAQSAYKFLKKEERTLAIVEPQHFGGGQDIELKVRTKIKSEKILPPRSNDFSRYF